jgi:LCP family protein required for cell wall assembly
MPPDEKPYRVYRGGRVRGKVPRLPEQPRAEGPGGPRERRRFRLRPTRRWLRWIPAGIAVLLVFVLAWALASYFQFRDGVSAANKRLPQGVRQALDDQHGGPTDILLLGTDHARLAGRESANRTDSITLLRVDGGHHRLAYLSVPRDLRVEIPGHGTAKVNAAMQLGGAALAVRTVRLLTGLPVNHVVVVDFSQFEDLIDKLGGIDIVVPERIVSKFDCPYPTAARCARWPGWRFAKGKQHMDGRRALIYSRVRKNALNPADSDFSRAEHQQAVLQAVAGKLTGFGTLMRLPFIGDDLLAPVATDISTHTFISLGWTKFRSSAGRTLHCRLGGESSGGDIVPVEENRNVIAMVVGDSAPQPPLPGSGISGPGCVTGHATLGVR